MSTCQAYFFGILVIIWYVSGQIEIPLSKDNLFSVDMSELEKEIIPSDKTEDSEIKKVHGVNFVQLNTKLSHTSTQISMKAAPKLDIVSPMWFSLIQDRSKVQDLGVKVDGHNNYKLDLITHFKMENKNILIVPRLSCEHNFRFLSDQHGFFTEASIDRLAADLEKRVKFYKIDGIYLDCLDLQLNYDFEDKFKTLIEKIGTALKSIGKLFIVAVEPYSEKILHFMTKSIFEFVCEFSDYVIVNVDEYNKYAKKPINYYNAPFFWMKESLSIYLGSDSWNEKDQSIKKKILIRIPFHGLTYRIKEDEKALISTIDSSNFFPILIRAKSKNQLSFRWDDYGKEHLIHILDPEYDLYVSYPTKRFFEERISIANNHFGGVAINELLQGFENFMDYF